MARKHTAKSKDVASLTHEQATRTNIPSAEHQSVLSAEHARATLVRYARGGGGLRGGRGPGRRHRGFAFSHASTSAAFRSGGNTG